MRFSGRIRFDDVKGADLDVIVEVTDTHVRLVSGDESLGSWCLHDVVANRLLANEFEIDLDGEVITFLADDQVNFAYGAVQQMAEGWARYHSMNLVRRKRAVATARRHNEPHRLDTVRRAFVSAREELARPPSEEEVGLVAVEAEPVPPEPEVMVVEPEPPVGEGTRVEEEVPAGPGFWDRLERATAAEQEESEAQADPEEEEEQETRVSRPVLPRGRLPRLDAFPRRRVDPEVPPVVVEKARATPPADSPVRPAASTPVEFAEEAPTVEVAPEPVAEPELPAREPVEDRSAVPGPSEPVETEPATEQPVTGAEETNGHRRGQQRAPLGSYRDGHHPSETTGLRASLRSLLTRSNDPHEHSFVESTTAVGITRRVCLECGHVSIGVSE